jgi:hypothetical protein
MNDCGFAEIAKSPKFGLKITTQVCLILQTLPEPLPSKKNDNPNPQRDTLSVDKTEQKEEVKEKVNIEAESKGKAEQNPKEKPTSETTVQVPTFRVTVDDKAPEEAIIRSNVKYSLYQWMTYHGINHPKTTISNSDIVVTMEASPRRLLVQSLAWRQKSYILIGFNLKTSLIEEVALKECRLESTAKESHLDDETKREAEVRWKGWKGAAEAIPPRPKKEVKLKVPSYFSRHNSKSQRKSAEEDSDSERSRDEVMAHHGIDMGAELAKVQALHMATLERLSSLEGTI